MMNEEKEIKILLTESEYNLLDRYFKWTMNITQTNHYFGSENDIRKKGDTYRIREKKGKYYLQVKVPQLYEGSLHVKKEYEKEVYRSYWDCYRGYSGRYLLSYTRRKN